MYNLGLLYNRSFIGLCALLRFCTPFEVNFDLGWYGILCYMNRTFTSYMNSTLKTTWNACFAYRWLRRIFWTVSGRKRHVAVWNTWSHYLQRVCEANIKESQSTSRKCQEWRDRASLNNHCVFWPTHAARFVLVTVNYFLCSVNITTYEIFQLFLSTVMC